MRFAWVAALGLATMGCAGRGGEAKQPMGHFEKHVIESPDDAPEEAKTVQVSYVFDRDLMNKEFSKSLKDGFDKKGVKVDEQLDTRAHFAVSGAKITGTVTYVKKGMGRYSILDADLVAEAHYDADVQMDLDVKVKGDTKRASDSDWNGTALGGKPYPIVTNMMPANIPIVGPLFLHAHFDLNAQCELGVQGQMHATAGVGIKGDVRLAAKYKKAGFVTVDPNDETEQKKSKFKFEAKAPNFELSPRPYLKVEGKQQQLKGSCSLQPTAVLLLEKTIGASLVVEPWLEVDANRASSKAPWKLGAEVGVTVSAVPEMRIFGRKIGKRHEYELMEMTLAKLNGPDLAPGRKDPIAPPATPVAPTTPEAAPPTAVASATPPAPPKAPPVVVAANTPATAEANLLANALGDGPSRNRRNTPAPADKATSPEAASVADGSSLPPSVAPAPAPAEEAVAQNEPPAPAPKEAPKKSSRLSAAALISGAPSPKAVVRKDSVLSSASKLVRKKR